eukprot:1151616-Pelagomonas_calceolata.AAC.1
MAGLKLIQQCKQFLPFEDIHTAMRRQQIRAKHLGRLMKQGTHTHTRAVTYRSSGAPSVAHAAMSKGTCSKGLAGSEHVLPVRMNTALRILKRRHNFIASSRLRVRWAAELLRHTHSHKRSMMLACRGKQPHQHPRT